MNESVCAWCPVMDWCLLWGEFYYLAPSVVRIGSRPTKIKRLLKMNKEALPYSEDTSSAPLVYRNHYLAFGNFSLKGFYFHYL